MARIIHMLYRTDIPNVFGNIYQHEELWIHFKNYQTLIDSKTSFGTFDTLFDGLLQTIPPEIYTHIITSIVEVPVGFEIVAQVIDNQNARIINQYNDDELRFGVRCIGEIRGIYRPTVFIKEFNGIDLYRKNEDVPIRERRP